MRRTPARNPANPNPLITRYFPELSVRAGEIAALWMQGFSAEETAVMYGMSRDAVDTARDRIRRYWGGGSFRVMQKEIMLDLLTRLEELELHLAALNGQNKAREQVAGGNVHKHSDPVVLNARRRKVGMRAI